MSQHFFSSKSLFLLLLVGFFSVSCNDDDAIPGDSDLAINNWIYGVMKEVYYWTETIPNKVNKNQPPMDFFGSLRNPKDDFSMLFPDFAELMNSLSGIQREAGYEFFLSRACEGCNEVIGIVIYIKPGSPAFYAGLKRGDVIEKINNKFINMSNYENLMGELSNNHTLTFSRQMEGSDNFQIQPDISLNVLELQENPNFLDTVYTVDGRKVAYYVYNFFADGVNVNAGDDNRYNDQMDAIFADFKSKGVTDLILDLRYNSGGAVSAATNLASLIGPGVGSNKMFYENKWNDFYQQYIERQKDGEDILRRKFKDKNENIGNLIDGRMYVLTGSRTASASELIINGLIPYMNNIILIGEKTVGKNVGSIPIEDEENAANHYGMLPIVFKIYNSAGFSEYDDGFKPDVVAYDLALPMHELGDVEETLLAEALKIIRNNGNIVSRRKESEPGIKPFSSSIDKKARTNRAILNIHQ